MSDPASIRLAARVTNYGVRTGPVIQVPGQVRGGGAILPLTAAQLNTVTQQAHAYVASGLATLVQQTGALAPISGPATFLRPGPRG